MTAITRQRAGGGVALALLAASGFGTSGSFATALVANGWTPGAVVTVRTAVAALVLTVPALLQLRRHWPALRAKGSPAVWRAARMVLVYGLVAIAACQLAYFNAVQRIDVGVALLLEYLGVVLVVGYVWVRHGQRPRALTVAGGIASIVGLVLVLNLTGAALDAIGVMWGLGAAVGLALFFVLSARVEDAVPPLVMAWGGMVAAAVGLLLLDAVGVMPVRFQLGDVSLAGHPTSWLVPVVGLSVLAGAVAYVAGIGAARTLGARAASFLGLTEVLFAILFAWLLLGQLPAGIQLLGGAVILAGVTLVRVDELRAPIVAVVGPDDRPVVSPSAVRSP